MARYIDADKLNLDEEVELADDWNTAHEIANIIKYAPTEDVAPVVHAKWIGKPIAGRCTVRCNYCRNVFLENDGKWKYCPNCGAKMEGEE